MFSKSTSLEMLQLLFFGTFLLRKQPVAVHQRSSSSKFSAAACDNSPKKNQDCEGLSEKAPEHVISLLLLVSNKCETLVAKKSSLCSLALYVGYRMDPWG